MKKVAGHEKIAVDSKVGRCTAAVLIACATFPALASDATPAEVVVAEARIDQPVRVQVDATSVPRLEAQESGFQAPRVDVSLFSSRAPRLGAMVGMSGFGEQQAHQPLGLQPAKPSVDVGLRYSHRTVDVMAWRRMGSEPETSLLPDRQPVYGARVEMALSKAKAPTTGFALENGRLGFQLESGARISIRRKDGRPMIYYKTTF